MVQKWICGLYHAAICPKTNAVLITNDKDFNKIAERGIINVWSITKAVKELLKEG